MRYHALFLFLLVLPLLWGCGPDREMHAAREVVAHAPEYIAPAERYQATVRGLSTHRARSIAIIGSAVQIEQHLVVDPLTLTLYDAQFVQQPFRVTSIRTATFSARISEAAANNYLRQQVHPSVGYTGEINNVRVLFQRNLVKVTAMISRVPVTTSGRVRIDDGLRVQYVPEKLEALGVGIPRIAQSLLADQVNPLVDLSGLRFVPHITQVTVNPGELLISGTAELRPVQ
jgi:hypothetical protein